MMNSRCKRKRAVFQCTLITVATFPSIPCNCSIPRQGRWISKWVLNSKKLINFHSAIALKWKVLEELCYHILKIQHIVNTVLNSYLITAKLAQTSREPKMSPKKINIAANLLQMPFFPKFFSFWDKKLIIQLLKTLHKKYKFQITHSSRETKVKYQNWPYWRILMVKMTNI